MTETVLQQQVMQTRTKLIKVGERHRKDIGDISALAASIEQIGLLQPIGIDPSYRLIYGERRLRAFEQLGRETIPARVVHVPSLLLAEHAENEIRKDFTPSERVAIGKAIEDELKATERRGRPKADDGQGDLMDQDISRNLDEFKGRRSDEIAAKKAGFGGKDTYRQAKAVTEQAETELVDAMDRGEVAISTAAKLATAPADTQREAAADPKRATELAHNHRAQGTGENEWYTPSNYLDAVREVLGGAIALDPASSDIANKTVQAERIFTAETDGLEQSWSADSLWMNPPYSQPAIRLFSEKLVSEWEAGRIGHAIALTHNYTDTAWFHTLAQACDAVCFTRGRIGFLSPDGKKAAPTQGQAFFYFGKEVDRFRSVFSDYGLVVRLLCKEAA
jgi:ParB family chromosome partitioning protein